MKPSSTLARAVAAMGVAGFVAGCGGQTTAGGPPAPADTSAHRDGGAAGATAMPAGATAGGSCVLNSDCRGPLVCANGTCHSQCDQTRDCPDGQRCVDQMNGTICLSSEQSVCAFNSDCPAPLVCALDRSCRNVCATDPDCLVHQICAKSQVCAEAADLDPTTGDVRPR